jgi:hypothetical protein
MQGVTYRPIGRIVVRTIGDEILLVPVSGPPAGARVYPVNPTARILWDSLSAGEPVSRAAERLVASFDAPSMAEALADCEACARAFVSESLLEAKPS